MSQICPRCGPDQQYDDAEPFCRVDFGPLVPYEPTGEPSLADGPVAASDQAPATDATTATRRVCWNCGTVPPNPSNTECLEPDCRRSLTPPALVIRFRDGPVELRRGERAELGRTGPYARLFRSFGNVSRRHAVVGVDADGRVWIEPVPTPNGTFVDEREIPASTRRVLRSGQVVRFALHAEGTVTLYPRGGAET